MMSAISTIPDIAKEFNKYVKSIGDPVTAIDIDNWVQIREAADKSFRVRTIVSIWQNQQIEERRLRRCFATWLLIVLSIQILFIHVEIFLVGLHLLELERWVATTFVLLVFGHIIAIALIVVKYLFPQVGTDFLRLLEKL
jgi:hypothetical protein